MYTRKYGHTHLFIGGWCLTLVPRQTKRKINTKAGRLMVKIGDSPLSSLYLPWSIYSHCTITATQSILLTPTKTASSPSYLWRQTKIQLYTSAEVSNSDCPLPPHTSPEHSVFQYGYFLHRSQQAQASSPHSCLHALVEVCEDGIGRRQRISEDWKWSQRSRRQDNGFVATSPCTRAINKQKHLMSNMYSDSVSSCCGLQRSSTIDLVSWQEVRGNNSS